MPDLSFVIPAYNEKESLRPLFEAISENLAAIEPSSWEICFVDDGSTDDTWAEINTLQATEPDHIQGLRLRRNFGKAEALQAGFEATTGKIVITMDADLQDDPRAIPLFLETIQEGIDLVSGWKRKRNDPLGKVLPSRVFNALARASSGIRLHDFNCGFKAYRREVVEQIRLYGEMHRFIPILADAEGFRIGEVEVPHHSRKYGKSKYGSRRFLKGLLDLVTVVVMTRYLRRPAHFLGGSGAGCGLIGAGILGWLSFRKIFFGINIEGRPLFFLGILLLLLGVQLLSIGLVAELINYHNKQDLRKHIAERTEKSGKTRSTNLESPL